jgi:hypothetical protein
MGGNQASIGGLHHQHRVIFILNTRQQETHYNAGNYPHQEATQQPHAEVVVHR